MTVQEIVRNVNIWVFFVFLVEQSGFGDGVNMRELNNLKAFGLSNWKN